jgi:phthalate 4,5-dioxygenase reductase subunit
LNITCVAMMIPSLTEAPVLFPVLVAAAERVASDIVQFEMRAQSGQPLPPFQAGAHIPVQTPAGMMRQYSLCGAPSDTSRYLIAVKRERSGRGGSASMVDSVAVGDTVLIGPPVNQFPLDDRARSFLLIAGGIGITPMLSMALALAEEGSRRFRLIYLTRDRTSTAFVEQLGSPELKPSVTIHHDGGDPDQAFDLWPLLEKPGSVNGQHVYCCGPAGLMDAVRDMTGHWPASAVHFESFGVDTGPRADDRVFRVICRRSGIEFEVPVGRSILETARSHGITVPSSCESGTCGSCKTVLLSGQADHRDLVLLPEERASRIMVCVSRAEGDRLELEL